MEQSPTTIDDAALAEHVSQKVTLRLVPFMILLYIMSYLDRINVSFAGLEMNKELGFSDSVFGLGAGVFFLGYFLFGVPSNLMVQRLGARLWISVIMVIWGTISVMMAGMRNATDFYVLRFLLGVAEAGFFPGMILYLTYWYRKKEHGLAVARFMSAIPAAGVLGGLIAAPILGMSGMMGLPGWKWLFIVTGTPSIILGIVAYLYLCDGPRKAAWLTEEEKTWLCDSISSEAHTHSRVVTTASAALVEPRVWQLAVLYFCLTLGMYGFQLWLPQIIQSFGSLTPSIVALLSAIPAAFQALGMIVIARHSDKKGERRRHLAAGAGLAAVSLLAAGFVGQPVVSFVFLCITAFGIWGTVGPFWALPTSCLSAQAAAAGIGLINSVGNLGGFAGPYIIGQVKSLSGGFALPLCALALSLTIAGLLAISVRKS